MDFNDFSVIFKVFIKIHEYANSKICLTYYRIKGLCLSFKMRPISISGLGKVIVGIWSIFYDHPHAQESC